MRRGGKNRRRHFLIRTKERERIWGAGGGQTYFVSQEFRELGLTGKAKSFAEIDSEQSKVRPLARAGPTSSRKEERGKGFLGVFSCRTRRRSRPPSLQEI